MNKWLSRTFWLVCSILVATSVFLWTKRITEAAWSGVITNVFLYWVGGDVLNKWKKPGEK
jgi:hypothetical protein